MHSVSKHVRHSVAIHCLSSAIHCMGQNIKSLAVCVCACVNTQLLYAVRCKTVQCLNAFTNDTQDVQTL